MLVIVALPVQLIVFVPGPKYSTIVLVPPETVNSSATFKIISLGAVHPLSSPVSFTPIFFRIK